MPKEIINTKDDAAAIKFAMTQVVDPQHFTDRIDYCYSHPEESTHEEVLLKDGRIIERYGNAIKGEDQTHYGFIWFFRDITQRKNAERIIKESEERFRLLADGMPQFVWTGDVEGNLGYFNRAVYEYSGLSKKPYQKKAGSRLFIPKTVMRTFGMGNRPLLQANILFLNIGLTFGCKYRWQLSRAIPQKNANGVIQQWIGTSNRHSCKNYRRTIRKFGCCSHKRIATI